jgi:hypothetical protein
LTGCSRTFFVTTRPKRIRRFEDGLDVLKKIQFYAYRERL